MVPRPPRSTLLTHSFPTRRSSDLRAVLAPAEEYGEIGFNFRMTDIQAAVGLVQLRKLPAIVARRRELAARYQDAVAGIPGLRAVEDPEHGTGSFQSFWVEVEASYPVDRDGLLTALADRKSTRLHSSH